MIARYRLFALLLGGTAGAVVLGQAHIAFRLVDTVRELTFTALWRLMLPALAQHQQDRRVLLLQVDLWLRRCVMIIGPLCVILAIGLTQVVALIMGPNWAAAGQAALPLVALLAWSAWTFPSGVALVALGQARFALYANLGSLVCSTLGVLAWRPTDPWQAVMIWTVSQTLLSPYLMWASARALRVSVFRPLTGGFGVRTWQAVSWIAIAPTRSRT
jgi:O-antigen/teichoic acid export membrane protein